jgi:seryl-tRNA synthetase
MLDMNFIREQPDVVRTAIKNKNERTDLDALLAADAERRKLIQEVDELRSRRKKGTEEIQALRKQKEDATSLIESVRALGDKIKALETELRSVEERLAPLLAMVPNIPAGDVPVGADPSSNVQVKGWGERKKFDFKPKPHWDLAKELAIIDFERATKITGTFFALYMGDGARLERALYNFMLDLHTREHGYREVFPPFLVNRASMTGTGQLPKLEEDMYKTSMDDLFLIPTAEVPLTNILRDEVLSHKDLPIYYTAYTACFRREAGSYGKDTRGLVRVHQFDKVELVKFVHPDTSYQELESLLQNAEAVLQKLGLEYRVMKLCTGDLSFSAAKCYDIELWAPGVDRWLEVSSCSNFTDFQARRANIRFRDEDGKVKFVHTLNGSGVALARLVVAIIENYQRADGSIGIPAAIRPYMAGQSEIKKK